MKTKICKSCNKEKPIDRFYTNGKKKNGEPKYRPKCKNCEGITKVFPKLKITTIDGKEYRLCDKCKENKPNTEEHFDGNRTTCRICRKERQKELREIKKQENFILYKCEEMSRSAYSRVFAPSKRNENCYNNLENPYGFSNTKEMTNYLYENFYTDIEEILNSGGVPSVDRKNTSQGYTRENIRIIPFRENTLLGVETRKHPIKVIFPNGNEVTFDSIIDCANIFNTTESNVRGWLSGRHEPRNKCKFISLR